MSYVLHPTSYVLRHMSYVICPTSYVLRHISYVLQGGWRGHEDSKGAKVREGVTLGKEELFQQVNREWKMNLEVKKVL